MSTVFCIIYIVFKKHLWNGSNNDIINKLPTQPDPSDLVTSASCILTHKNSQRLSDLSTSNVWPNKKAIVQLANQVVGKFKNTLSIVLTGFHVLLKEMQIIRYFSYNHSLWIFMARHDILQLNTP